MNKSEHINELALALSQLQGKIQDAHKDKQGYGYKYADLGSVLEIARPLLALHGLSVTQLCSNEGDRIGLETVLLHSSGQWLSTTIAFDVQVGKGMTNAQGIGSVISYMRRYSLTAMLGITQTDDDAAIKEEAPKEKVQAMLSPTLKAIVGYMAAHDTPQETIDKWLTKFKVKAIKDLPEHFGQALIAKFKEREEDMSAAERDAHA